MGTNEETLPALILRSEQHASQLAEKLACGKKSEGA